MSGTKTKQTKTLENVESLSIRRKLSSTIPLYVDFYDVDHSAEEERYLIVGKSNRDKLLIVSYTERKDLIRIISAREVTRSEREAYEEG